MRFLVPVLLLTAVAAALPLVDDTATLPVSKIVSRGEGDSCEWVRFGPTPNKHGVCVNKNKSGCRGGTLREVKGCKAGPLRCCIPN